MLDHLAARVNGDANLVRAGRAAHQQVTAVRKLADEGQLATLDGRLQEIAELRLRHPSLSLRELGEKCRPPLAKASVHRRMQKLVELAQSFADV